mmetsp:Transcript_8456/g.22586  ORF Transcript_8456/g.22586 Transcript_8456/m.22586 type:complete len:241 (+) Transcript_8456:70-792(+)
MRAMHFNLSPFERWLALFSKCLERLDAIRTVEHQLVRISLSRHSVAHLAMHSTTRADGAFRGTKCQRSTLRDVGCHLQCALVCGENARILLSTLAEQPHAHTLVRVHAAAAEGEVTRSRVSDDAAEALRTTRTWYDSQAHLRQGNLRLRTSDAQVARQCHFESPAKRDAVKCRDGGHGKAVNGIRERTQARHKLAHVVDGHAFPLLEVRARAEDARHVRVQDEHARFLLRHFCGLFDDCL